MAQYFFTSTNTAVHLLKVSTIQQTIQDKASTRVQDLLRRSSVISACMTGSRINKIIEMGEIFGANLPSLLSHRIMLSDRCRNG